MRVSTGLGTAAAWIFNLFPPLLFNAQFRDGRRYAVELSGRSRSPISYRRKRPQVESGETSLFLRAHRPAHYVLYIHGVETLRRLHAQ
jgi:hypothetical protein